MPKDQIILGALVCALSLASLAGEGWLLENTRKGRALVRWFGPTRGRWVLRGLLTGFALFGALLALDIIRPVRWR